MVVQRQHGFSMAFSSELPLEDGHLVESLINDCGSLEGPVFMIVNSTNAVDTAGKTVADLV